MMARRRTSAFRAAGLGSFFRAGEALERGLSFRDLSHGVESGELEKISPGLYRIAAIPPTELETIAMVSKAVPNSVVCLLSALSIHHIGTQLPHDVWLAIDRKARKPRIRVPARVRFVRFSGSMLTYGVETRKAQGGTFRITSPARTVVDCFRYRNKVGLDVALEALRDVIRSRAATMDEISRAADVCRASRVMRPYIEALVS